MYSTVAVHYTYRSEILVEVKFSKLIWGWKAKCI